MRKFKDNIKIEKMRRSENDKMANETVGKRENENI